ncbi:MAG: hypothetical protein RIK87_23655 [Fuerstiella sp.]
MKTSAAFSRLFGTRPRRNRRRIPTSRVPLTQRLEARQLLTAGMMWDGDTLQIVGSDNDDFIAVQQDESGVRIFTEDTVSTAFDGRSFDTAGSIVLSGQGGNDILFSYQTDVPVSLNGDLGNDFLFSDKTSDVLDGGAGSDWIQTAETLSSVEDAFGLPGLNPTSTDLTVAPQFDEDGRLGLQVAIDGEVNVAGRAVDVTGLADVSNQGVDVEVTGAIPSWNDAFGIDSFDLTNTSLTVSAGTSVHDGSGYRVAVSSGLHVSGTDISIDGEVDIYDEATTATFTGTVASWDNAFGVAGLDLTDALLTGSGAVSADNHQSFYLGVSAEMQVEDTSIEISGHVDLTPDRTDVVLHGSVDNWDDAFGITGLDLTDSEVSVIAFTDHQDDYRLQIDVLADMQLEDTAIEVSGSVDVEPDRIDAAFQGSVNFWDDAFGIAGLNLVDSDLSVTAYSDRRDDYDLHLDLRGNMQMDDIGIDVSGRVDILPDEIDAVFSGSVENWGNAFGIAGLNLKDTRLTVKAVRDDDAGSALGIDLAADMELSGTEVAVTGQVDVAADGVRSSLTGVVAGTWTSAFGIGPLHLQNTTLSIAGSRTSAGSELSLGVAAGMNLLGIDLGINGTADVTPAGVHTTLTGSVTGEWMDAFGVPGLQLRDTNLSIGAGSDSAGLDIKLDTDLQLFGDYIDMIGDLGVSPTGVDVSFSPPASIDFTNLLGIPGFTLDDADLTVTAGTDGLEVALGSTMDLGNLDVDFEGSISVSQNEVQASLTGHVAEWDNAFEVPGLNLNDVVLTLGAESGIGGASMFIGLGAGIEMGRSEVSVAGLVGFGATGWEVAFRGSVDSLASDDLIDFANTMNQAGDPNAAAIPDGSLGDLELRAAFINFAPKGGNEALGIADGFGIGGAFYNDGKLLGSGAFIVDLANGVFEAGLDIPKLDLGPVELSDVIVDIRLAPTDSHYHVAGTAELMGAEVSLEGRLSSDSFSLQGSAAVDMQGLAASVDFIVDQNGIRFVASAGGGAINAITGHATESIRAVANVAQAAIDHAQAAVDLAKREVRSLEADLADARADAQKEVDKVKSDINKAKVVVDSARASKDYWYKQKQTRYKAWRSAVNKTNQAVWYKKAYYKGIEASKYASYAYAAGRYSAQVVVYKAAVVGYNAVRNAAGWVLDNAGVEANPDVLRLKGLLAVANLGLGTAELLLDGVEQVNAGILQTLDFVDSLKVNRITIAGNVSDYVNAGVRVTIDCSIGGKRHLLTLNASTENMVDQLGRELLSAVL